MDKVVEAVDKAKKEWDEAYKRTKHTIESIERFGVKSTGESGADQVKNSLPRLNGLAQDGVALLSSLQFNLDLLAPQLPTDDDVLAAQSLRSSLRSANLQAKANMRKAAQEEDKSRNDICCRKHHREPSANSSADGSEESTGVLKKAEGEYKGHRSLLSRTRNLLSTMQRQDVLDRVILVAGFLLFSCAVIYVVSKRMGILKLQRMVTGAIKAGMAGKGDIRLRPAGDVINFAQVHGNAVPRMEMPLEQPMHDEL
ncbi:hypothetical protein C3L33_04570, partial [Rhododendron williamsianum]